MNKYVIYIIKIKDKSIHVTFYLFKNFIIDVLFDNNIMKHYDMNILNFKGLIMLNDISVLM